MTDASLRTRCPHCDAVYRVQQEHLGKRARCAKCHDIFAVDRSRSAMADAQRAARMAAAFRDWEIGDTILDLYQVRELVGEGGFGKVYRVFHRDWQLDLAVKSPNQEAVASARGIAYLEREAETWVQLGLHPHTVSCYYVRRVDGIPRVFAEYVRGGDLRGWIRDGRLYRDGREAALSRIIDIAIQFAWGLHHAHEHRVIHQDVKPANLMLSEDGVAKVADFGLAHAKGVAAAPSQRDSSPALPATSPDDDTIVVEWAGCTPRYASPEQMATSAVTRRTDVWSWAVSVLEMFKGGCTWESGPAAGHHLSILRADGPARPEVPMIPEAVGDLLAECFREAERDRPRTLQDVARRLIDIHGMACGRPYARPSPNASRDMADNLNNRAISLLDLGREAQARRAWDGALRAQPHHPESTYNAGLLDWRSGRLHDDELVKRLEEGRAAAARGDIGLLLAAVHMERGDCESARAAIRAGTLEGADAERAGVIDQRALANLPRSRRCLRRFNHGAPVYSVALAQGGDVALSAGVDGTVRVWSVDTGDELGQLANHRATVSALAVDVPGRLAASGDQKGRVVVWDLARCEAVHVYEEHFGSVDSLFLSADGSRLLTGGEDQLVRLWDTDTRSCLLQFRGLRAAVAATWLSQDGSTVLAVGTEGVAAVWRNEPESQPRTFEVHDGEVSTACVSPDESLLLTGSPDGGITLCELGSGARVRHVAAHNGPVTDVALMGNDRALSTSLDGTLRLWDLADGRCLHTFQGHRGPLAALAARPETGVALSGSRDGGLRLWMVERRYDHRAPLVLCRLRTAEELHTSQLEYERLLALARRGLAVGDPVQALHAARDARALAGYEQAPEAMAVWRTLCQSFVHMELQAHWESASLDAHEGGLRCLVASSNGRTALTAGADCSVKRWNLTAGRCEGPIGVHEAPVGALDLSLDCRLAASGADDGSVRIWDVHGGECLRSRDAHSAPVTGVALRHDSALLATAGMDGQLALWDVLTGHRLRTLRGRAAAYHCATMSRDGAFVIAGTDDGRIAMWSVATGEARTLGNFDGHVGAVTCVCASEDGHTLLTGGIDGALIVWDMTRDVQLKRFTSGGPPITSVAISPDGEYALSGARDGQPRLWRMDSGDSVDVLRAHQRGVTGVAFGHNRGLALIGDGDGGDIVLLKLAGDDGSVRWKLALDGTTPADGAPWGLPTGDEPWRIAATAAGDIIVSGGIDNATTGMDFLVAGFDGNTGTQLWRYAVDGMAHECDQSRALVIDAGAAIAVGAVANQDTALDAFTLMIDARTGREIWRTTTSGPLPADQVCEAPGGHACGEGPIDQPATTTSTTSSTTTTTTTTGETATTTLSAGAVDGNCDDGDPCTTSDRMTDGVCAGTIAGVSGVECRVDRLAAGLCDGERLQARRTIDRRVKRTQRLLAKVLEGRPGRKAQRLQRRGQSQLSSLARKIARLARKPSMQRRLTPECFGQLEGLVSECRQLAAILQR